MRRQHAHRRAAAVELDVDRAARLAAFDAQVDASELAYVAQKRLLNEAVVAEPARLADPEPAEATLAPVDELLSDLMKLHSDASVAVEMPPAISVVTNSSRRNMHADALEPGSASDVVYIEVMS